jgi:exonuclease III
VETWTEDDNAFSPGRLDYVVYSDASARAVNAFVFDTRRLTAAALAKLGLDVEDSASSDHLPVIVDLVAR